MVAEGPLSSISLPALPIESPVASSGLGTQSNASAHVSVFVALGTVITIISLILLALLILLIRRKKKELEGPKKPVSGTLPLWKREVMPSPGHHFRKWKKGSQNSFQRFKYSEIQKATDDFSTIIGRGGFGTVYKARFDSGLTGAVKRMNTITKHSQQEFSKEMEFLGRLHHRHLVRLRGFCMKKHERFLVYEYMENGSLKEHLQGTESKTPLSWRTRLQIAIDVASALEYLHCYCEPPLCHRDIKSSNILLDEKFMAKVADFGLALATPDSSSDLQQITTDVRGTPGYMDPEYVTTRRLTDKSDIYSYGVLLLELITGRAAVQGKVNLVEWAQKFLTTEGDVLNILDPDMNNNTFDVDELKGLLTLVKMCTRKEGKRRPTIQQVLRWLQEKLDLNNAENLQHSSAFMLPRDYLGQESPSYFNRSDEIGSLSSSMSGCTLLSECCVSFRFETTNPPSHLQLDRTRP